MVSLDLWHKQIVGLGGKYHLILTRLEIISVPFLGCSASVKKFRLTTFRINLIDNGQGGLGFAQREKLVLV